MPKSDAVSVSSVGFDIFEDKLVELDHARRLLTLREALSAHVSEYGRTTGRFVGAPPAIDVELVGGARTLRGEFVLDTGGVGTANVNRAFATERGLQATLERISTIRSRGVGAGSVLDASPHAPESKLAGCSVPNVPIHAELPVDGERAGQVNRPNVVDMQLLARFDLLLDCASGVAYFRPNQALDAPFERRGQAPSRFVPALPGTIALAVVALAACRPWKPTTGARIESLAPVEFADFGF